MLLSKEGEIVSEYIITNGELYHYGVRGMRWGVRNKRVSVKRVERDAKRLANLRAKEASAGKRLAERFNVATYTNSLSDRRVKKVLDKTSKQLTSASNRANKFMKRMKKKYKNTPYSDIETKTSTIANGRSYCSTLIGRVGDSPIDGTARYLVTAGTWTK